MKRCDTEGVDGVEEEDHGDESLAGCIASGLGVDGHGDDSGNPDRSDSAKGTDHHRAATKLINESGTKYSL